MAFTSAYTSMSGIDLTAVFGDIVLGTLQGISYSITREKAPVYTFGSANPRSFSRGKRGIAGSCVFTLFDRGAMEQVLDRETVGTDNWYYRHAHEAVSTFSSDMANSVFDQYAAINSNANPAITTSLTKPEYADQVMPFDVTLVAQNEYGLSAFMVIIGLEILNEGGGLSVDDITNEEQMTYVARGKSPWIPAENTNTGNVAGETSSSFGPVDGQNDRSFFIPDNYIIDPNTGLPVPEPTP